jgi:hypothetical protein
MSSPQEADAIDDLIARANSFVVPSELAEVGRPGDNNRDAEAALFRALGDNRLPWDEAPAFLPALRVRGVEINVTPEAPGDEQLPAELVTAAVIAAAVPAVAKHISDQRFLKTPIWEFKEPKSKPPFRVRGQVEPAAIYGGTIDALIASLEDQSNLILTYWGEVASDGTSAHEGWVTDPRIMLGDTAWTYRMGESTDYGWAGCFSPNLKWAVHVIVVTFADGTRRHPIATAWYAQPEFHSYVEQHVLPLYRCIPADAGDPDYQPVNLAWLLEHPSFEQDFAIA